MLLFVIFDAVEMERRIKKQNIETNNKNTRQEDLLHIITMNNPTTKKKLVQNTHVLQTIKERMSDIKSKSWSWHNLATEQCLLKMNSVLFELEMEVEIKQ